MRYSCALVGCVLTLILLPFLRPAAGQRIGASSLRPFVIGTVPVVGPNGAVGGVSIDAQGVLQRRTVDARGQLRHRWQAALTPTPDACQARSGLRKISLRRLEAVLAKHHQSGTPLPQEVEFLGGLQRIRYVFIYPDVGDIVFCGPAEGWEVSPDGEIVGQASGQPVLRLEDLLVALRSADAAGVGQGITCSIDPTEEGLRRFQSLVARGGLTMSPAAIRRLEKALGPSTITVTGIPADTRFAQVLVAADHVMKCLAMGIEPSPVADVSSYLQLLGAEPGSLPAEAVFRLWLTPHYDVVLRDQAGLAWELDGSGVRALSEDGRLTPESRIVDLGKSHPAAEAWAAGFTRHYDGFAERLPIFAELQGCIDMAVAAAIVTRFRLSEKIGLRTPHLKDEKLVSVGGYETPLRTASQASFVRQGQQYLISISGGVDLDSWAVLDETELKPGLMATRATANPGTVGRWWWD